MDFQQVLATAVQKAPLPALANDLRAVALDFVAPDALVGFKKPNEPRH